jgi:CheY-like chemotaxis protein
MQPTVLIVEDEFLVRMDAVDMIRSLGFEVVEVENADDAIRVLEDRPDITVVFTDIQMPGSMDGLKLAAAIRGRWPPIKIVATSGLSKISEDDLPPGSRFVHKPYNKPQIAAALRAVIGQTPS